MYSSEELKKDMMWSNIIMLNLNQGMKEIVWEKSIPLAYYTRQSEMEEATSDVIKDDDDINENE